MIRWLISISFFMNNKQLIIFGMENFAKITHYYFTNDSKYTVAGFTVDGAYVKENTYLGLPVVPFEDVERHFPPDLYEMFVAVGIRKVNQFRAAKVLQAESKGYRLASYVSSHAIVASDLKLGPNTMIMQSNIAPFVEIGRDSIIWVGTAIGMNGRIGEHSWIVAATLGESVVLGDYSFVGLRAIICPFVKVAKRNVIGAGALIGKDTREDSVYKGLHSRPSTVPSYRLGKLLE
jgi:sugar O-acyltransferase (sialic acid O-acetyltransferase NeuD family)